MKSITKRKLSYGLGLVFLITTVLITAFNVNYLLSIDKSVSTLLLFIFIGYTVMIVTYIFEFFKKPEVVKKEQIQRLNNLILFRQNEINQYEKMLEKIKSE